jgi:hypothetical protein
LFFLHASGRRGPISHFFASAAPQCPPSHVFEAAEETLQQEDELVANQLDHRHIWIQELQLKHDCESCTLSRQDGAEQLVRSSARDAAASPAPTPPSDLPPRYQAEEANSPRNQVEQIRALPISSSISNGTDNAPANVSFENQEENNALFNGTECELGCCVGSVKAACIHLEIKSDARDINPTEKRPSSFKGKSAEFGHLFELLILVTCIDVHVWRNADLLCRISLLKENMICTTDVIGVLWPLAFIFVLFFARLWEYLINQCSRWCLLAHQFCAHFKSHLLNVPLSLMANLVMSSCIVF